MPNAATVKLAGHLGKPPEFKVGRSGNEFCRFSIAVNSGKKESPVTSWYDITATGYAMEQCRGLDKGDAVLVTGRMEFTKTAEGKGPYLTIWADLIARFARVAKSEGASDRPAVNPQPADPGDDVPF